MPDPFPPDTDPWRTDARAEPDLTDSFWGGQADWAARPGEPVADVPAAQGGAIGRWWSAATAGRSRAASAHERHRSHGAGTDEIAAPAVSDDDTTGNWSDGWDVPVDPPRSGVDPLLARLGGLAVVLTLLVPVVIGFMSDSGENEVAVLSASGQDGELPASVTGAASTAAASSPAEASATAGSTLAAAPNATPPVEETAAEPAPVGGTDTVADDTDDVVAAPAIQAESLAVPCGQEYEIVAGDFWIRIADGSGADIADLLAVNGATQDTPLYPGRSICLPVGVSPPPPPDTIAPPPAAAPDSSTSGGASSNSSSSTSSKRAPATTTAPTTAPTTTAAPALPPASNASAEEVEVIIRDVWPDDLEEKALEVAWRESNYRPTAKNSCCYGVFQMYWSVHRSWLGTIGITSADQLYDPTLNARAALALYERSGGWGPWGG